MKIGILFENNDTISFNVHSNWINLGIAKWVYKACHIKYSNDGKFFMSKVFEC